MLTLHGSELLNLPVAATLVPLLDVTTDRASYRQGESLVLSVHYSQGTDGDGMDAYVGLRRPDGGFGSLQLRGGHFALVPTGSAPTPAVQGTLPRVEFSGPLVTRPFGAGDPVGTWIVFAVLVRAGQSPLAPVNWLGIRTATFTLGP